MLHEGDDLRHRTLSEGLRGTYSEDARKVHTTRDHLVADIYVTGQRLARQSDSIQGACSLNDNTVQWNLLAWLHNDDRAHGDGIRTDVLTPRALLMGDVGADVHEMSDAVATLTLGVALEEFTHLEEEHHEDGLGVLCLGTWEKTDQQGTDGCNGHKEVLVEGFAVDDTLPRLMQRLVAY